MSEHFHTVVYKIVDDVVMARSGGILYSTVIYGREIMEISNEATGARLGDGHVHRVRNSSTAIILTETGLTFPYLVL